MVITSPRFVRDATPGMVVHSPCAQALRQRIPDGLSQFAIDRQ